MPRKSSKKPAGKKDAKNISPKKTKGKTVKQLRDLHLKDKNHVITNEELKNLKLELNNPDTSTAHTPDIPDDSKRPKDEDKDPKMITPWDLIKE